MIGPPTYAEWLREVMARARARRLRLKVLAAQAIASDEKDGGPA